MRVKNTMLIRKVKFKIIIATCLFLIINIQRSKNMDLVDRLELQQKIYIKLLCTSIKNITTDSLGKDRKRT